MSAAELARLYSDLAAIDVTGIQGPPGPDGADNTSMPVPGGNGANGLPGIQGATNDVVPAGNYFNGNPGVPGWYAQNQRQGLAGRNGVSGSNRVGTATVTSNPTNTTQVIPILANGLYYVYASQLAGGSVTITKKNVDYLVITTDFHYMLQLGTGDTVIFSGVPAGYNKWAIVTI